MNDNQTCPMLMQFSYDDRQKSVDLPLKWMDMYKGPKYFNCTGGHHGGPDWTSENNYKTDLIVQFFRKHVKGETTAFLPKTSYRYMKTPEDYNSYRQEGYVPEALELNTSSAPTEVPTPFVLVASGGDYHLVQKNPSDVSATAPTAVANVVQTLNYEEDGTGHSPVSTISNLVDYLCTTRSSLKSQAVLDDGKGKTDGSWFTVCATEFYSEELSEDITILGPVSGYFTVSSDTSSSQFAYDVLDYAPSTAVMYQSSSWSDGGILTETINPRSIAIGYQSFHNTTDASAITTKAGFQYYTFRKGHKIGIRLKNHTYFGPVLKENNSTSCFQVAPIIGDFDLDVILSEAVSYIMLPVLPDVAPVPEAFKGGGWPRMRDVPLV